MRSFNNKLPIETGRYRYVLNYAAREHRIITKCDSGVVGDECHRILTCTNPELMELRENYISSYYSMFPSLYKPIELFNNKGKTIKKNLARYALESLKL